MRSESIKELAAALAKAQAEIMPAAKDTANTFFKSKYADLASVWEACRGPLTKNGLSVVQMPASTVEADCVRVTVETLLLHESGEWISSTLAMTPKENTPQAVGSVTTYLRRYSLAAMVGVAPDDDDAEAAHGRAAEPKPYQKSKNGNGSHAAPSKADAKSDNQVLFDSVLSAIDKATDSVDEAGEIRKSRLEKIQAIRDGLLDENRTKGKFDVTQVAQLLKAANDAIKAEEAKWEGAAV